MKRKRVNCARITKPLATSATAAWRWDRAAEVTLNHHLVGSVAGHVHHHSADQSGPEGVRAGQIE